MTLLGAAAMLVGLMVLFVLDTSRSGAHISPRRSPALAARARTLVGCTVRGPSEVFRGGSDVREIALTFDDGPWSTPPAMRFVDLLAHERVPATFFVIGNQLARFDPNGSIERGMLAAGDMIAVHTWSHPRMTSLSVAAQRSQLQRTAQAIKQRTGFTPCLWRPPGGVVDTRAIGTARSLGLLTIMWDVDPRDWALPGSATIAARVVGAAHNGAIVIQHFGGGPRYQTLAALTVEPKALRCKGYRFVTITQLLGLKLIYR